MPNKARASYEIKIGESVYVLRPTFEAIMEFQEKVKTTAFKAIENLASGSPDPKIVVAAIWAGILGEHLFQGKDNDAPSFSEVGAIVMDYGVSNTVFEAYAFLQRATIPDSEKKNLEKALPELKAVAEKIQASMLIGEDSQAS